MTPSAAAAPPNPFAATPVPSPTHSPMTINTTPQTAQSPSSPLSSLITSLSFPLQTSAAPAAPATATATTTLSFMTPPTTPASPPTSRLAQSQNLTVPLSPRSPRGVSRASTTSALQKYAMQQFYFASVFHSLSCSPLPFRSFFFSRTNRPSITRTNTTWWLPDLAQVKF